MAGLSRLAISSPQLYRCTHDGVHIIKKQDDVGMATGFRDGLLQTLANWLCDGMARAGSPMGRPVTIPFSRMAATTSPCNASGQSLDDRDASPPLAH